MPQDVNPPGTGTGNGNSSNGWGSTLLSYVPVVGNLMSGIANWASTGTQNLRQRQFAEEMYFRQRNDALADWNMQNEYNSPKAQMQRLQDAHLNPNLVYGHGADATSASMPRAASQGSYNPKAPQIDPSMFMSIYDARLKSAQIDNLQAMQKATIEEATLKRAQTAATIAGTDKTNFEVGFAKSNALVDTMQKFANVNKTMADTTFTLDKNEREEAMQAFSLGEAAQRILLLRAQRSKIPAEIEQLKAAAAQARKSIELQDEDLKLKKDGIQPHDALWQRTLKTWLDRFAEGINFNAEKGYPIHIPGLF